MTSLTISEIHDLLRVYGSQIHLNVGTTRMPNTVVIKTIERMLELAKELSR